MLRTLAAAHYRRRSGAVLIVVLAMLVLFAVLGLTFVLYSESQKSAANSEKIGVNQDSPPNAMEASEFFLGSLLYPTTDEANPLRGHSVSDSKYGFDQAGVTPTSFTPFAGSPNYSSIPTNVAGQSNALWNLANVNDRDVVNFTRVVTNPAGTEWFVFDPMRSDGTVVPPGPHSARTHLTPPGPAGYRPFTNRAAPFTYPDRTNYYLAQMNPNTGEVVLPSFHRPDLFGSLDPTNVNWTNQVGRLRTLRPRTAEHPNFPAVPMDPDGVYRGDVSNLKFVTGLQRNDSLWMYNGGPVLRWRGKNYAACIAPLVLDLSSRVNLSIAGNLKNLANNPAAPHASKEGLGPWEVNPLYTGMTATDLQLLIQRRYGKSALDNTPPADPYTAQFYTTRINGGRMPAQYGLFDADGVGPVANDGPLSLPLTGGFQNTPIYNNPLVVAAPYRYEPTQNELLNASAAPGTGALAAHPNQFNPLLYRRGPTSAPVAPAIGAGGLGHDDLIRLLTHYSDPKGGPAAAGFGQPAMNLPSLNPAADTAAARQARALSTTFSTTQHWAGVPVYSLRTTDAPGTPPTIVRLGPVDLNRPLPDYRKNPALPPSPVNLWNPAVAAEQPYWYAAHSARQRLARDIFVRMAARYGLINGTTAVYYVDTGNVNVLTDPGADVTGNALTLMRVAQMAVNLVDYIDGDDVVTPFVWRPTPTSAVMVDPSLDVTAAGNNYLATNATASRVVYGTELPRLVINEVYSGLFNTRTDMASPAANPLKRRYWIELHNPTPGITTSTPGTPLTFTDPARSDLGAARLRYQTGVTQVVDPVTLAAGNYTGTDFNPYRIEVAVAPNATTINPYVASLGLPPANPVGGYGAAAGDTVAALTASSTVVKARIDNYTPTASAPPGPNPILPGDAVNYVLPATSAAGTNAGNVGYYLIGPEDQFPPSAPNVPTNSLSLPDAPAGIPPLGGPPAQPVNALTFDETAGAPTETDITTAQAKPSVVILRRLLNPYMPPNDPLNAAGVLDARFPYNSALPPNPYITVDFLENLPTRDRVQFNNTLTPHTSAALNAPSVGRIHPYAAFPDYGTATLPAVAAVQDQVDPANTTSPPHTFFNLNQQATLEHTRPQAPATPVYGFEWLTHLDRELVSLPEAAHASRTSPALLTHAFFNGTPQTGYHGHAVGLNTPLFVPINSTAINVPNDYIRMLTDAEGLITCGSRLPGTPLGGRETGKININTANDQRLLNAVFDPQAGNGFTTTYPNYVPDLWANRMTPAAPPVAPAIARTANGLNPRATIHEGGTDYPFMWGSTSFSTAPAPPRDHPFGRRAIDDPTSTIVPNPLVFPNPVAPPVPALAYTHPYLENEPLRKAWNNLTPTSDSFLVLMTVGFFEVENTGPWTVNNQPRLGAELYDKVPGDLRAQFGGVIDRSQLFTQIADADATGFGQNVNPWAVAANPVTSGTPRAVQTKLTSDCLVGATSIDVEAIPPGGTRPDGTPVAAGTCAILGDGVVYIVGVNSRIRVGYGDSLAATNPGDGEWLTVTAVNPRQWPDASGAMVNVPGQVTLTLSNVAPVTRFHPANSPVGNVVFGNPGPQPGVRLTELQRRGLVPYFSRIEP